MSDFNRRAFLSLSSAVATASALPAPASARTRAVPTTKGTPPPATPRSSRPIEIMAHRGACALRPEHSLASYAKAIADGADYIEPDLMPSKDGVLMALHEPNLANVTDIAQHPEFASRKRTIDIEGTRMTGWFVNDFTFAELKTLRLKERIPEVRPANTYWDGEFQMLSLDEIVDFVAAESATRGRLIGLVMELKAPTLFARAGLPLEDRLVDVLEAHSYLRRAPIVVECFEASALRTVARRLTRCERVRTMMLVGDLDSVPMDQVAQGARQTYRDMLSPDGLKAMREFADIVAPDIRTWIPLKADGTLGTVNPALAHAKAAGLSVGGWEFRPENRFLAADFRDGQSPNARNIDGSVHEILTYLGAGMDSFFTDDPGVARLAVERFATHAV